MCDWRTSDQYEVDCILGKKLGLEIKSTSNIQTKHLKGLKKLQEEETIEKFMIVSLDKSEATIDGIKCFPINFFLQELWQHKII